MTPPAEFHRPPEKDADAEAYLAAEDAAEDDGSARGTYREYGHLGPAIYERPFRAGKLKEWPLHTDFRPHETAAEERDRWD